MNNNLKLEPIDINIIKLEMKEFCKLDNIQVIETSLIKIEESCTEETELEESCTEETEIKESCIEETGIEESYTEETELEESCTEETEIEESCTEETELEESCTEETEIKESCTEETELEESCTEETEIKEINTNNNQTDKTKLNNIILDIPVAININKYCKPLKALKPMESKFSNTILENIDNLELPPAIDTFTNNLSKLSLSEKFNEMMGVVKSKDCQRLKYNGYIKLSLYIKDMIENDQQFLSYTLEKNNTNFMIVYKQKIINKQRIFKQFENNYADFALAWLMYEYH